MNDCITTTKQSTTKPCAYFLGYTEDIFIRNHRRLHKIQYRISTYCIFAPDRPWIWPGIKSISNNLDIAFHVRSSQLLCLEMHLWCHEQFIVALSAGRKPSEWDNGSMWEDRNLISSFMDSIYPKETNNACTLVTNSLCACSIIILMFISLASSQLKHQKITFSWAHAQFTTRVHTLFYTMLGIGWNATTQCSLIMLMQVILECS